MSEESDSHTRTSPFLQWTCREIVNLTGRRFLQPVWAVTVLYWTWEDARTKQIENNTNITHSKTVFGLNTTYMLSPCPGWHLWPESNYQSKCLIQYSWLRSPFKDLFHVTYFLRYDRVMVLQNESLYVMSPEFLLFHRSGLRKWQQD